MILPPPGRRASASSLPPVAAGMLSLALVLTTAPSARAQQNIGSVRDNEFRSRWANYQVDRPATTVDPNAATAVNADGSPSAAPAEQAGLLAAFGRSLNDYFRNGPLQVRGNLSAGYEFTDEDTLRTLHPDGAESSPFLAPAIGLFYNQERGPLTISARYSAGYVYYLDQNYLAAAHDGGIFSQTAGLDLGLEGKRTTLVSHTTASYGNGNDIESGELRNLLSVFETLEATYQLTNFTQFGATGSVGYQNYSGGTVAATSNTTDSGSLYGDYVITGKTRLRAEFDAGQQLQDASGSGSTSDRYFYQAIVSANYAPAPKLSVEAGFGYGFQNASDVVGRGHEGGSHPVYRLTIQYAPTARTTASFHFGYEGVDVEPDLQLNVAWQFRANTSSTLSLYQNTNYSTYEVGDNIVTRGVLISLQQRLFGKVDVTLGTGAEQSTGYATDNNLGTNRANTDDPYYFAGVTVLYEINSYLAVQGYYRGFTGEAGAIVTEKGLQSRAALSLRLTF